MVAEHKLKPPLESFLKGSESLSFIYVKGFIKTTIMKLKYLGTLLDSLVSCYLDLNIEFHFNFKDGVAKIRAITVAPNNRKIALATADLNVVLFDEKLQKRDKFSTKPVDSKVALGGEEGELRWFIFSTARKVTL